MKENQIRRIIHRKAIDLKGKTVHNAEYKEEDEKGYACATSLACEFLFLLAVRLIINIVFLINLAQ